MLSGFFCRLAEAKKQTAKHLTHTENQMLENELLDFFHRCPTDPHHHHAVRFRKFDGPIPDFPKTGWNGLAFESILIDDKQMEQLTSR
jgi:hypothetical protein